MKKTSSVAILAALLGSSCALSQTFFGVAYKGPIAPAILYVISPVNGSATPIGPIGATNVSGIAFAPDGVTLYGVGFTPSNGSALLKINTNTGAGTVVGSTLGGPCQDMAFRPDGVLFCYSGGNIFTINTTTGLATLVGSTGAFLDGNGLAFLGNTLYNANQNELDTINQSTGAPTLVVKLSYSSIFGPAESRASAMKFHPNGTLYATVINGFSEGGQGTTNAYLAFINISTGVVTPIGPTAPGMDAFAISPQNIRATPPLSVPVPTTWLLVATGLALVLFRYKTRNAAQPA